MFHHAPLDIGRDQEDTHMTRDNSQGYLVTGHDNICILCNVSPHSSRVNPLTTLGGARNSSGTTKSWNIMKINFVEMSKAIVVCILDIDKFQEMPDNT